MRDQHRRVVDSEDVGAAVLDVLSDLHEVAYLRFASVYKSFTSPEDFHRELARLDQGATAVAAEDKSAGWLGHDEGSSEPTGV